MLKSEAEHMVRRAAEETNCELTEEQIKCIALATMKIAGRLLEESTANTGGNRPGSKSQFFAG